VKASTASLRCSQLGPGDSPRPRGFCDERHEPSASHISSKLARLHWRLKASVLSDPFQPSRRDANGPETEMHRQCSMLMKAFGQRPHSDRARHETTLIG
jgi:hypothetical protein